MQSSRNGAKTVCIQSISRCYWTRWRRTAVGFGLAVSFSAETCPGVGWRGIRKWLNRICFARELLPKVDAKAIDIIVMLDMYIEWDQSSNTAVDKSFQSVGLRFGFNRSWRSNESPD